MPQAVCQAHKARSVVAKNSRRSPWPKRQPTSTARNEACLCNLPLPSRPRSAGLFAAALQSVMRTAGRGLHSVAVSILSLMRVGLHERQVLIRVSEAHHGNCSIEQTIYWTAQSSPLVMDY